MSPCPIAQTRPLAVKKPASSPKLDDALPYIARSNRSNSNISLKNFKVKPETGHQETESVGDTKSVATKTANGITEKRVQTSKALQGPYFLLIHPHPLCVWGRKIIICVALVFFFLPNFCQISTFYSTFYLRFWCLEK